MGLKRNQKVRLVDCPEAEIYPNVVLSCKCDSYTRGFDKLSNRDIEVVKLKELAGEWHVECLQALTQKEVKELNK